MIALGITGRSGCGKSTLLKLLAGKEQPDAGQIDMPQGWHSALLSPDPYVITWTNVQRNVAMACGVGKTPEERYEKRLEQEKPVLDALLSWANEMQVKTAPKSALGRAIHYLLEQWPYLTRYLEDGRLELSNNRAERSIKPFVMGRKNWLFANTPGGARASAVIYSLIETAKENELDPYRYLLWVLQNAPQLSEEDAAWAEKLLPARAPKECYMPHK